MTVVKMYVLLLLVFDLLVWRTDGERLCSCYTFSKDKGDWPTAKQSCEKSNKTLVIMETEEEWQFITNKIQKQTGGSPEHEWLIGLQQNFTTRNWTWINGKPLTIDKWLLRNPDPGDSYGLIHKEFPKNMKGSFSTVKLNTIRGWICEEEKATCQGICFHYPLPINTSPRGTSAATKAVTAQGKTSTEQDITAVLGSSTTVSTPTTVKSTNEVLMDDKSSSSPTIMIVAASLGAVLFVALIILIAVMLQRRKKRQGEDAESAPPKNHSPKMSAPKNEKDRFGESQYESVNPVEAAKLLGSANSTPDMSETRSEASPENCEYAVVNKANKKRKEGDLVYAQLADFDNETDAAKPPKPPSYEPTIYADVEELPPELPGREDPDSPQPTYANLETTGV